MSTLLDELEKQTRTLTLKEKAALVRILLNDLDTSAGVETEPLWIDEAKRRYEAFLRGELKALPGEEVMAKARRRLA